MFLSSDSNTTFFHYMLQNVVQLHEEMFDESLHKLIR